MKNLLFGGAATSSMFADLLILAARVTAGLSLALAHGLKKMPPSDQFVAGVEALGFPAPAAFAWMAGLAELGGGFLLAVGFFTRPAAFFAGITMFVASFMAHSSDPFQKQELSLIYLAMFLIFVALGGGRFSIDRLFRKG